ncbi:MAG: hypothetical protein DRN71_02135 [Candidatus Nanohalarchaeota archaeon]|nr:MAG: hypothetical protein DRN71_02135 [Candidatus Nanohaloarchaeota archaeon]
MQKQILAASLVIIVLMFTSQAQALTPAITGIPKEATVGDKINFTFNISISLYERIPITEITLKINDILCTYAPDGTPIARMHPVCSAFTLTRTHHAPYTYGKCRAYDHSATQWHCYGECKGYGCGEGYGDYYCNTTTHMTYSVLWDTSTFSLGAHTIKASATAEITGHRHTYNTGEETVTLTMPVDTQQTTTYTGSSRSSGTKAATTAILIKETPRLEIISIIIPKTMHPYIPKNITITIKNTGSATCKVNTTLDLLNRTQNQLKEINPKEQSTYTYNITPTIYHLGNNTAKITIRSGAKIIEREILFTVKEKEKEPQSSQQKKRTFTTIHCRYNNKTGTITLKGCIMETIQDPKITIGNTTIPLKKDQKNCFNIKISTTSLSPGIHTLNIKDNSRTLYTKSFTIPEKTPKNNPSGNIIQYLSYIIPMVLLALLILFLLLIARKKQKTQQKNPYSHI